MGVRNTILPGGFSGSDRSEGLNDLFGSEGFTAVPVPPPGDETGGIIVVYFNASVLPSAFQILFGVFGVGSSFRLRRGSFSGGGSSLVLVVPRYFTRQGPLGFHPYRPWSRHDPPR